MQERGGGVGGKKRLGNDNNGGVRKTSEVRVSKRGRRFPGAATNRTRSIGRMWQCMRTPRQPRWQPRLRGFRPRSPCRVCRKRTSARCGDDGAALRHPPRRRHAYTARLPRHWSHPLGPSSLGWSLCSVGPSCALAWSVPSVVESVPWIR